MGERAILGAQTYKSKKDSAVSKARKTDFSQSKNLALDPTIFLQRTMGNQAVQKLLRLATQRFALGGIIEELGWTRCNPYKGKMEWKVNYEKVPTCMWPCAERHEKTHVEFMEPACSHVSTAIVLAEEAIKAADKFPSGKNLANAEQAAKVAENAAKVYDNWVAITCQFNEKRAYQAGIDECATKEVRKTCKQLNEMNKYDNLIKQWKAFKDNPPNCPTSVGKREKKKEEKKETVQRKELPGLAPEVIPEIESRKLLSHELTHVVQQNKLRGKPGCLVQKKQRSDSLSVCKGSQIRIEVATPRHLTSPFTKDIAEAILNSSPVSILVPKQATKVTQDELIDASLQWSCPDGRGGMETKQYNIPISVNTWQGAALEETNKYKLAKDAHVYGPCCKPLSDMWKSVESKGSDMQKCKWELVDKFVAITSFYSQSGLLHRCKWGFHLDAEHAISKKGVVIKNATVKYWGVDKISKI